MKCEAICLKSVWGLKVCTARVLYEYELSIAGEKVRFENWGGTAFYPRKGKRYKVLVNKKDYSKVVGYAGYVTCVLGGILLGALSIVGLVFSLI